MNLKHFLCTIVVFSLFSMSLPAAEKTPVDYINLSLGSIGPLATPTEPMVHLPNSMVRFYAQRTEGSTNQLHGLPVTITSTGESSAFHLSPIQGREKLKPVVDFSFDHEKVTPYFYSVFLDEAQIAVRYAPTQQAGVYEFVYGLNGDNYLVFNTRGGAMTITDWGVSGHCQLGKNGKIHVAFEIEQKPIASGVLTDKGIDPEQKTVEGDNQAVALAFGDCKTIRVRYGVSLIDEAQALRNLQREIKTYSWNEVAKQGREVWNKTLGKISVQGGTESDRVVLYTALFRTYQRMINISEGGRYFNPFGKEGAVYEDRGAAFYTDDQLEQSIAASHPLRMLIEPRMASDIIQSYIRMGETPGIGRMPTAPQMHGESNTSSGRNAVVMFCDAMMKGYNNFELEKAYDLSKVALTDRPAATVEPEPVEPAPIAVDNQKSFFTAPPKSPVVVVKAEEPAVMIPPEKSLDYWCLARIAQKLGFRTDYDEYLHKSCSYRTFLEPKPSPPVKVAAVVPARLPSTDSTEAPGNETVVFGDSAGDFCRLHILHRVNDLVRFSGSASAFESELDAYFRVPFGPSCENCRTSLNEEEGEEGEADQTAASRYRVADASWPYLPYLYNYIGRPWKTQKQLRINQEIWYRNDVMGLPGGENMTDVSASIVFNALGFHPAAPGLGVYHIGLPAFPIARVHLGGKKMLEIQSTNFSPTNKFIQSATLNGKPWNKCWFEHADIARGGRLILVMGNRPNPAWGTEVPPPSAEPLE